MWDLDGAIVYYRKQGAPGDQTALVALLREIQQENGGRIPAWSLELLAEKLGLKSSFLFALIRRYPTLRLGDGHSLEICAGPNCSKHGALRDAAEAICKRFPDKIALKYVPCMRLCGKGPNLKWDGKLYHKADRKLLEDLIENL